VCWSSCRITSSQLDAVAVDRVEHALADRLQVGDGLEPVEDLDLAAHRARGLERVVGDRQVGPQQRLARRAVDQPQVLVGGDVAEIPRQRAHDRREHCVQTLLIEVGDELERPLTLGGHRRLSRPGRGWLLGQCR
jgi:hypothetical protein